MYSKIKNWKDIKEIKPIDELGLTKYNTEYYNKDLFYKYKDGTYCPYLKKDIQAYIDPLEPETFLPFIQAFDIPFSPDKWIEIIEYQMEYEKLLVYVFGKYLNYCKLVNFKQLYFQDSEFFQTMLYPSKEEIGYQRGYNQAMKEIEEKIYSEKFQKIIKNILEDILKDYKIIKK